ncbi:MAG: M48 family metalloprotease [Candidatus Rifleibacteriota bacterium]
MKTNNHHKKSILICILTLAFISSFFLNGVQARENEISALIEKNLQNSTNLFAKVAQDLAKIIPDPEKALKEADSQYGPLKKAFHMMHKFYTVSARVNLPKISLEVEKKFSNDFFDGFFSEGDNAPELVEKMTALSARMQKQLARKDLNVKVGILSGGGIMGFAKGGEWIVFTDEMAHWPEDEIAGVIAHEMRHLEKRDFVKIMLANVLNKKLLAAFPENLQPAYKRLLGLCLNRWQRFFEYETDIQGADLMIKAGIDPNGLMKVLNRLGDPQKVDPKQYLILDHPTIEERKASLKRFLSQN